MVEAVSKKASDKIAKGLKEAIAIERGEAKPTYFGVDYSGEPDQADLDAINRATPKAKLIGKSGW